MPSSESLFLAQIGFRSKPTFFSVSRSTGMPFFPALGHSGSSMGASGPSTSGFLRSSMGFPLADSSLRHDGDAQSTLALLTSHDPLLSSSPSSQQYLVHNSTAELPPSLSNTLSGSFNHSLGFTPFSHALSLPQPQPQPSVSHFSPTASGPPHMLAPLPVRLDKLPLSHSPSPSVASTATGTASASEHPTPPQPPPRVVPRLAVASDTVTSDPAFGRYGGATGTHGDAGASQWYPG